jgi:signal transduction histidine kinase
MGLVTILWSMGAAVALTLALIYGATWVRERRLFAYLFYGILAIASAMDAGFELGLMHSATPAEYGEWLRWYAVPVFVGMMAAVLFVRSYLGTGRLWALWVLLSMRAIQLVANFILHPNVVFSRIDNLRHMQFLGEQVSLLGHAAVRPWLWLGRASLLLAFWFTFDAAATAWRTGDSELRRKALVIIAGLLGPSLISWALSQLTLVGVLILPYLQTPAFLVTLIVMALELSREMVASGRTKLELAELRGTLAQVGRVSIMGQLSSALAHELNQPLGAILRNTDVAELDLRSNKPDLEELRSIVADTGQAVRRAKEIIDRMHALIKRREVDMRPLAIDDLVRDVMSLARAEAASKQVLLSFVAVPGLPPVAGDRVHISQVLLNLIANAMDAVQVCPVGERRVVIQARVDSAHVEVAVCDSGPGIPAGDVGRIFEPLFSTKSDGLGMGLAICRTIIDAHGGRLWVEHNNPRASGATFRFLLPRTREPAY